MDGLNNMRKLRLGVFVSAFMLLMSSCDRVTSHYVESYIMGYELYDGIHAYTTTSTDGGIKGIGLSPSIYLDLEFRDDRWKGVLYDSLCFAHGDMDYNRNVRLLMDDVHIGMAPIAFNPNPTSLDVVSDKDFDSMHPAGKSLSDVIDVTYMSYGEYVKSHYTSSEPTETVKRMSELTEDDLFLLSIGDPNGKFHSWDLCVLTFAKVPDNREEPHNLTITITTSKKVFTTECEWTF